MMKRTMRTFITPNLLTMSRAGNHKSVPSHKISNKFIYFFSVKFFEKVLTFQLTFHCKQTLCSFKKKKGGY